jgi:hypothetical protein
MPRWWTDRARWPGWARLLTFTGGGCLAVLALLAFLAGLAFLAAHGVR